MLLESTDEAPLVYGVAVVDDNSTQDLHPDRLLQDVDTCLTMLLALASLDQGHVMFIYVCHPLSATSLTNRAAVRNHEAPYSLPERGLPKISKQYLS